MYLLLTRLLCMLCCYAFVDQKNAAITEYPNQHDPSYNEEDTNNNEGSYSVHAKEMMLTMTSTPAAETSNHEVMDVGVGDFELSDDDGDTVMATEREVTDEITVETKVTEVKTVKMSMSQLGAVSVEEKTEVHTNTGLNETRRTVESVTNGKKRLSLPASTVTRSSSYTTSEASGDGASVKGDMEEKEDMMEERPQEDEMKESHEERPQEDVVEDMIVMKEHTVTAGNRPKAYERFFDKDAKEKDEEIKRIQEEYDVKPEHKKDEDSAVEDMIVQKEHSGTAGNRPRAYDRFFDKDAKEKDEEIKRIREEYDTVPEHKKDEDIIVEDMIVMKEDSGVTAGNIPGAYEKFLEKDMKQIQEEYDIIPDDIVVRQEETGMTVSHVAKEYQIQLEEEEPDKEDELKEELKEADGILQESDDEDYMDIMRAVSAYEPENDDALSLHEGERVELIDNTDLSWWRVRKLFDNRYGNVPAAYLKSSAEFNSIVDEALARHIEKISGETSENNWQFIISHQNSYKHLYSKT